MKVFHIFVCKVFGKILTEIFYKNLQQNLQPLYTYLTIHVCIVFEKIVYW